MNESIGDIHIGYVCQVSDFRGEDLYSGTVYLQSL